MRNLKIVFKYDGTRYQGWQKPQSLNGSSTLCAKLTDLLSRITDQPVLLFCSEKTEPGVHAYSQVINFHTDSDISCSELLEAMNRYLPNDIVVLSVTDADSRFRSDLSYTSTRYIYHICCDDMFPVSQWDYAYSIPTSLDIPKMEQAVLLLSGKHDFKNFSTGKKKKGTEKTLSSVRLITDRHELYIVLECNHFLHQMPNLLIGTLLDIGASKRSPESIQLIFSRKASPSTPVPNKGLFLDIEHIWNNEH